MFKNTRRRYDRIIQRAMEEKITKKNAVDYFLEELKGKNAEIKSSEIARRVAKKKIDLLEGELSKIYAKEIEQEFNEDENENIEEPNTE